MIDVELVTRKILLICRDLVARRRRGRAIAELRPMSGGTTLAFACDAGRVAAHDDFDVALPDFDEYTR